MSFTRVYGVWRSMLYRCRTETSAVWKDYGGRGIQVCDRWLEFDNFYADMGDQPKGHQLERINNDRGYEPGNCRWATVGEQARNRRTTVSITLNGETKCMSEWARQLGVTPQMIYYRLRAGWSLEDSLLVPSRKGARKETT